MPRTQRNRTNPESTETPVELMEETLRLRRALEHAHSTQEELRGLLDEMMAPPWYPALLQRVVMTPMGPRALVWTGNAPRLTQSHRDVDVAALVPGQRVYLSNDHNTIMALADDSISLPMDSAAFERLTPDGRLVVQSRNEELVLEHATRLDTDALRAGHHVLFDRASHIALEMLEAAEGAQYLLEDAGDFALEGIGGSRVCLDELVAVLSASLVEPELARSYGLNGRRAVLLYGPPGCGKTLAARTAAAELQRITGRRCRFAVVHPGEFESPYVGETEANIRACFGRLREEAGGDLAVLFLDEIEAIGRARGGPGSRHADRFLAALLAEIDGFKDRGQVAIVAATNRRDLLDPALLSRLSDVEIAVPRPDMRAAREIFAVHLSKSVPFSSEEHSAEEVRREVLDTAVSRLYAPNAANEVSELQLRDGTCRTVHARELASGRLIEQIALATRERAFRRHLKGDAGGVTAFDVASAVEDALVRLSSLLSVHNARAYLDDLPDDVDVVRVEPIRPRPPQGHRYLHAS
ncbi:MAG: AAA family ATPase [Deltaproteobacteria bacterium]|nr:AAA family ATPase [Deltaproteobacteria bacterium]MBW2362725.1 AAA family ATPase [Deltaproteobacteria bacterium]